MPALFVRIIIKFRRIVLRIRLLLEILSILWKSRKQTKDRFGLSKNSNPSSTQLAISMKHEKVTSDLF